MILRSRSYFVILLCIILFGVSSCSTTSQAFKVSQETMSNYDIGKDDIVLVHWAKTDNLQGNSFAEPIRILEINESGITGLDKDGLYMEIGYRQVDFIEYPLPDESMDALDLLPLLLCLGGICPTP